MVEMTYEHVHLASAAGALLLVAGCGAGNAEGTVTDEVDRSGEPSIASVVSDPPGDDLRPGAGEHVVIANDTTIRADLGGWFLDIDGVQVQLGIGTQIDAGTELRVHPGPGSSDAGAVFADIGQAPLRRGALVVLRDLAGDEVDRYRVE